MKTVLLCGGVGGSKLALGLYRQFPDLDLTIIVNTADDIRFHGLLVCPDIDTVTYTLSGLVNEETGWGIAGDTFGALDVLKRYGEETWFGVGDRDLGTHLLRNSLLLSGCTLTEAVATITQRLGISAHVLPMSDDRVATQVRTSGGWLDFQDYFVRRHATDPPLAVQYLGIATAKLTNDVREAIRAAERIVVAPSNPILSIGPIIAMPGMSELLFQRSEVGIPVVAVSPFIGNRSITGPADRLIRAVGFSSDFAGLMDFYSPWLSSLIVHESEGAPADGPTTVKIVRTNTLMPSLAAKQALAEVVMQA